MVYVNSTVHYKTSFKRFVEKQFCKWENCVQRTQFKYKELFLYMDAKCRRFFAHIFLIEKKYSINFHIKVKHISMMLLRSIIINVTKRDGEGVQRILIWVDFIILLFGGHKFG